MVLCMITSRTVMFDTQALVLSLPSPPMLIPCPGPQLILCMYTFVHPVCIDIQSSPATGHVLLEEIRRTKIISSLVLV